MRDIIEKALDDIEQKENVTILLAVESGSRAWGFASPDSDYDVRFLYVRTRECYLKLNRGRDVIEYVQDGVLDINGWDFDKTLKLLHTSNPTLFEWLRSPIVYRKHEFTDKLIELSNEYFLLKNGLHHYLNMAEGNYREFLKGEEVLLKKYFYVIRPMLACRHILSEGTPPPMRFEELLYARMDKEILPYVEKLLEAKKVTSELGLGPRVDVLNEYIDNSIQALKEQVSALPDAPKRGWEVLNALFLQSLELKKG